MVGTFVALAVGQLLIGHAKIETAAPFNVIVTLFAVVLVMMSTTRAEPPRTNYGDATPLWPTLACRARGGYRLRGQRDHRQHLLRARAGVDAGRGHRTNNDRAVHARGSARRACVSRPGRAAFRPVRPARVGDAS